MLKIRLSMGGAKKRPVYKVVVADSRFPRDGRFIEKLGFFNPLVPKNKKDRMKLEIERIKYWMSKGAKPTTRVARILGEAEVIPMPAPGNNPLKGIPKKDRNKTEKDGKEDTKKEAAPKAEEKAAPKAEEKKDQKPSEKKEAAPKAEEKKDQK
jgi:small subunit ribosomal protein S16